MEEEMEVREVEGEGEEEEEREVKEEGKDEKIRIDWIDALIEEERSVDEKEKRWYGNDWDSRSSWRPNIDVSSLPDRCRANRMVGCCHFGYYFNPSEGRCDSLYTDSDVKNGPNSNYFATKA